jgi:anthranilate synthase/aminodeoxychorismate synthase-like glutamine amidotransferase
MSRVLIIDNYDSFTHNLAQLLHGLARRVEVRRNDEIAIDEVIGEPFDHVILSPGPGTPERRRDFGVCGDVVAAAKTGALRAPVLGVCLGHQGIAHGFGGRVVRAEAVMHGKTSPVEHAGRGILEGLESPFEAMRYHSLVVDPATLPACFEATAFTPDGVLMAIAHRALPLFGVQFHPESIGTPLGKRLIGNFLGVSPREEAA